MWVVCRFVRGEVAEYVWWCDARGESVFVFAADGDGGLVSWGRGMMVLVWDFGDGILGRVVIGSAEKAVRDRSDRSLIIGRVMRENKEICNNKKDQRDSEITI